MAGVAHWLPEGLQGSEEEGKYDTCRVESTYSNSKYLNMADQDLCRYFLAVPSSIHGSDRFVDRA